MIDLSLEQLAGYAIGLTMALIVFLHLRERRRVAKHERRAVRDRVVCRLCLAVFEATSRDPVQTCPECGGETERGGSRPLG
jgi:rRNA maturation endonuclease Nob1